MQGPHIKPCRRSKAKSSFRIKFTRSGLNSTFRPTPVNCSSNLDARLSKELSECLRKLGIMKLDVVHTDVLVGHQTDLSYLAPLFVIYEEQIKNYDKMLENLIEDLRTMESKIQIVNEDNYYLRR